MATGNSLLNTKDAEYEANFNEQASRLSCQIVLQNKHNGLIVYVP